VRAGASAVEALRGAPVTANTIQGRDRLPAPGPRAPQPSLSKTLQRLFPAGVHGAQLRGVGDCSLLRSEERSCVSTVAPERAQQFAAGRLCARHVLSRLGWSDFALLPGPDRAPQWPTGVRGSISHCAQLCGAVCASSTRVRALGLDIEGSSAVLPRLWPRVCTPAEIAWLIALPLTVQVRFATLIFAAKEAFYKAQYTLSAERIGFADLRVEVDDIHSSGGKLCVSTNRELLITDELAAFQCRFIFWGQYVCVGVALPPTTVT
jgi:4'-phosphopantetheinyl transferase EntD